MEIELSKEEIGLILAALDWYELSLSQGKFGNKLGVKARIDALSIKLFPIFFGNRNGE